VAPRNYQRVPRADRISIVKSNGKGSLAGSRTGANAFAERAVAPTGRILAPDFAFFSSPRGVRRQPRRPIEKSIACRIGVR